jgi:hypothetical protein
MRKGAQWKEGILIGILALSALWLGSLIWSLAGKSQLAWQQAHDTKTQYEQLETRKATLESDINTLSTPLGQDAAIRQAFGVARPRRGGYYLGATSNHYGNHHAVVVGEFDEFGSKNCGYGLVVEQLLPKQRAGVRFSLSAHVRKLLRRENRRTTG